MQEQTKKQVKSKRNCSQPHALPKQFEIICCNSQCAAKRFVCALCFIKHHNKHKQFIFRDQNQNDIFTNLLKKYHENESQKENSYNKIKQTQQDWQMIKQQIKKKIRIIDQKIIDKKKRVELLMNGEKILLEIKQSFQYSILNQQQVQFNFAQLVNLQFEYTKFELPNEMRKINQMQIFMKDSKAKDGIIKNLNDIYNSLCSDQYDNLKGKKKQQKIKKIDTKLKQLKQNNQQTEKFMEPTFYNMGILDDINQIKRQSGHCNIDAKRQKVEVMQPFIIQSSEQNP